MPHTNCNGGVWLLQIASMRKFDQREYMKKWRSLHAERLKEWGKTYRFLNKDRIATQKKVYADAHKEHIAILGKKSKLARKEEIREYVRKNKERFNAYHRKYRLENKITVLANQRKYQNNKMKINTHFRIARNLRERLRCAIKRGQKSGSAVRDLGCTIPELKMYLEGQFKDGMTWDNWRLHGWHIDHKIPLDFFDLTDREQLLKAVHYTNLQPLWALENWSKSAKVL